MRAMLAAENGLLAIKLGGKGDVTSGAVKWKYQRPVPQVPSTLLYKGVLFMVNDSGILISFDPATGNVLKQGRLKGAIDKYFASPVGADGKVFLVSQDGTVSVVDAKGDWEILVGQPARRRSLRDAGDRRRPDLPQDQVDALRVRRALALKAADERAQLPSGGGTRRVPAVLRSDHATDWRAEGLQGRPRRTAIQPNHVVLDIGCGTGTLAVEIKRRQPAAQVIGVDPDPKALALAVAKARRARVDVRFARGFADALEFGDATLDRVFSSMMFHHIRKDDKPKVLAEIRRVLKPGGSLELIDFAGNVHSFLGQIFHGHKALGPPAGDCMLARLRDAGFPDAQRTNDLGTVFGRVAFYQAVRRAATGPV